ncbi:Inter-alpha-trypsin inhibitor heavy chain H4 [Chionoecetes opilio]|uniref:Inter-alpha-trypsin inhibitor heavy chain H4 n=1 Tax=Chionoecetes opilio TaxID=41210 RepID=A0A8J4YC28_CHIOP|nr:Inter-alpha-trypsin inhibitor heavy chain H4 [Chionoecetes opilio]
MSRVRILPGTQLFRPSVTWSTRAWEELLERRLGVYSHKINVHPGYPVRDLLVDVTIHETRDINTLTVKKVPGGPDFRDAVAEWREGLKTARLRFYPNPERMPVDGVLHGQLEVQYDVSRALDAGDVQVEDGYFVHFFAPTDLQYTPKHITFLIDVSGSMAGTKLTQVKEALQHILTELNQGDTFNIVRFSSATHKMGTMRYTGTAVRKARNTSIAWKWKEEPILMDAIDQDVESIVSDSVRPHIIVLLTDGQPTVGVTSENVILRNVRERNRDKATIFSLGFGSGADMELLEKISLQNRGSARKIYEDSDGEQLRLYQDVLALSRSAFSYIGTP